MYVLCPRLVNFEEIRNLVKLISFSVDFNKQVCLNTLPTNFFITIKIAFNKFPLRKIMKMTRVLLQLRTKREIYTFLCILHIG